MILQRLSSVSMVEQGAKKIDVSALQPLIVRKTKTLEKFDRLVHKTVADKLADVRKQQFWIDLEASVCSNTIHLQRSFQFITRAAIIDEAPH